MTAPEWFSLSEETTSLTMKRIAAAAQDVSLPMQVKFLPLQAHWFVLDSLLLANRANREGMHANALAITRQCLEGISVIELGISSHKGAADILAEWESDKVSPGEVRKWLSGNVWPSYGCGLWDEPWAAFMAHLARAVQPYAHYTTQLAQWQSRLHRPTNDDGTDSVLLELRPRAYDPQKAGRITLFHAILTWVLARIWIASAAKSDGEFQALVNRLGKALGKSKYLDGHETNWEQQFWAIVWSRQSGTILEE